MHQRHMHQHPHIDLPKATQNFTSPNYRSTSTKDGRPHSTKLSPVMKTYALYYIVEKIISFYLLFIDTQLLQNISMQDVKQNTIYIILI